MIKHRLAHRLSYSIHAEDPGELNVNHHCDNKLCVNPNHLYAGTQQENVDDALARGQWENASKLTEDEVIEIREKLDSDITQREIANQYGVTPQTVCDIKHNRSWKQV